MLDDSEPDESKKEDILEDPAQSAKFRKLFNQLKELGLKTGHSIE